MANPAPVDIPKPPNEPDLKALHKWALSMYIFMTNSFASGTQSTFFSQDQLNQMVSQNDLRQAGKVFMNHDTGRINAGTVVGGNLTMQVL
jgi:hypothetical protein